MKESIGATQLFVIVIAMVLIFGSIITFTTNRSNAFAVKDAIISIIEENGTFDAELVNGEIVPKLQELKYRVDGNCPDDGYTGYTRNGDEAEEGANEAAFCIKKIEGNSAAGTVTNKNTYRVVVFAGSPISFFNQNFNFQIVGETKGIK